MGKPTPRSPLPTQRTVVSASVCSSLWGFRGWSTKWGVISAGGGWWR